MEFPEKLDSNKAAEFIEEATSNARGVQDKLLKQILETNAHVEYLQSHGLAGRSDAESFKRHLPIVTYQHIQPQILRIADGDRSPILCSDPITEFLTSSGTSGGRPKLLPTTIEELRRTDQFNILKSCMVTSKIRDPAHGKRMFLVFVKAETITPSGIPARTVSTSYSKRILSITNSPITTPPDAVLCEDAHQTMYAHLLCGLFQRNDVIAIGAPFASIILRTLRFLQDHWHDLIHDISTGTVNQSHVKDKKVRSSIGKIICANPSLGEMLEQELSCGSWNGIMSRLWPNLKYVETVITGSMAQYVSALKSLCGEAVPIVCTLYATSEGYFGLNLDPFCGSEEITYTLMPNMAYYEFLDMGNEEVRDIGDVEIGKEYELVVTTRGGLYRYRMGDVLKIKGFCNEAPAFEFVKRRGSQLSVDMEKTDESELQRAVSTANKEHLEPLGMSVEDYTTMIDGSDLASCLGHYVVFLEVSKKPEELLDFELVMEACCESIERRLNTVYRRCRTVDKSVGALEVRVVRSGTFEELLEAAVAEGASMAQYKVPRCLDVNNKVKDKRAAEILQRRTISKHFAQCDPPCEPSTSPSDVLSILRRCLTYIFSRKVVCL